MNLTAEFLVGLGFIEDGYTNLSYDYYLNNEDFSIFVNLRSTCDKRAEILVFNKDKNNKKEVSIKESRESYVKHLEFTVDDLRGAIKLSGIDFEV